MEKSKPFKYYPYETQITRPTSPPTLPAIVANTPHPNPTQFKPIAYTERAPMWKTDGDNES